jgi:hypothetical protein
MNTARPVAPVIVGPEGKLGILGILYIIWVLSLPFRDFHVIAAFSVDNLLVPIIALFWAMVPRAGIKQRGQKYLMGAFTVLAVYVFGALFDQRVFQGDFGLKGSLWNLARDGGYFIVPMLMLGNRKILRYNNTAILAVASIGCITALLVSLDLLHIQRARIDDSRVGIDVLNKATGIFTNFGDLAILLSYSMLVTVSSSKSDLAFGLGTRLGKSVMWSMALIGLAGTQSRNILLSTLTGLVIYWSLARLYRLKKKRRRAIFLLITFGALIMSGLLIVLAGPIIDFLSNLGGGNAGNTAAARLTQYRAALDLLSESLLFGISYADPRHASLAAHIHNLWLGLFLRGGIFGVLTFALLIFIIIRRAISALDRNAADSQAKIILSFACAVLVSTLFFPGGSMIFWFLLGVACSSVMISRGPRVAMAAK